MSVAIVSRTIGGIVDQRMQILNQAVGRTLSIGSNWNDLRILLRLSILSGGASFSGGNLFVGMGSGTAAMYGEATTTHAVGYKVAGSLWTYYTGWTYPAVYYNGGFGYYYKKVGTTETQLSASYADYPYVAFFGQPATAVGAFVMRFRRISSTSLGLTTWVNSSNNATASTHITRSMLVGQAEVSDQSTYAAALNLSNPANSEITVTGIDEATNGVLDTVQIYWSHSTIPIEISDILISKFA